MSDPGPYVHTKTWSGHPLFDLSWHADAECATSDPALFVPDEDITSTQTSRRAKTICAKCPVKYPCRVWGLEKRERYGVWGELVRKERMKITSLWGPGWGTPAKKTDQGKAA